MSAITMVQAIKEVHKTDIAMVKIGEFYHVYGKDAYIVLIPDTFDFTLQ